MINMEQKQRTEPISLQSDGYERLAVVLQAAFIQAAFGKGKERHANTLPFHEQPMQQIARSRGLGFILGQADKKSQEAQGMLERGDADASVRELLGAINYLAGAVVFIQDQQGKLKRLNAYTEAERLAPLRRATDWPQVANDNEACCNGGLRNHIRCKGCQEGRSGHA